MRKNSSNITSTSLQKLLILAILYFGRSMPNPSKSNLIIHKVAENDIICNYNVIEPYIDIEPSQELFEVDEIIHGMCPFLKPGDPFCCKSNHVQDLLLQYKSKLSYYLVMVSNLNQILDLVKTHKGSFTDKKLAELTQHKCPKQIDFGKMEENLNRLENKKKIISNVESFLTFNLKLNFSFLCEICNPTGLARQKVMVSTVYEKSHLIDYVKMITESGSAAIQAYLALESIISDLYCMEMGQEMDLLYKLSPELKTVGSEAFKATLIECEDDLIQNFRTSDECTSEITERNKLNSIEQVYQLNGLTYNAFQFLNALFNLKRVGERDLDFKFLNVRFIEQRPGQAKSSGSERDKSAKKKMIIDSDPSERLDHSIYGKELKEMEQMEKKGTLVPKESQLEDSADEKEMEIYKLEFPNELRMFEVVNTELYDKEYREIETVPVFFWLDQGLNFNQHSPAQEYWDISVILKEKGLSILLNFAMLVYAWIVVL